MNSKSSKCPAARESSRRNAGRQNYVTVHRNCHRNDSFCRIFHYDEHEQCRLFGVEECMVLGFPINVLLLLFQFPVIINETYNSDMMAV